MGTAKPNFETTELEMIQRVCRGETDTFYKLVQLVQPCEQSVFIAGMSEAFCKAAC
jgi:hypothetical protein